MHTTLENMLCSGKEQKPIKRQKPVRKMANANHKEYVLII